MLLFNVFYERTVMPFLDKGFDKLNKFDRFLLQNGKQKAVKSI